MIILSIGARALLEVICVRVIREVSFFTGRRGPLEIFEVL